MEHWRYYDWKGNSCIYLIIISVLVKVQVSLKYYSGSHYRHGINVGVIIQ